MNWLDGLALIWHCMVMGSNLSWRTQIKLCLEGAGQWESLRNCWNSSISF